MTKQQLDFLRAVIPGAQAAEEDTGIPACVTVSQAILESATKRGWGTSCLFLHANNPFGIKASHVSRQEGYGEYDVQTWEVMHGQARTVIASFVKYPSLADAFKDHSRLLCTPHYKAAYEVRANWQEFADRLGPKTGPDDAIHCGYSTNPAYGSLLAGFVRMYGFDKSARLAAYLEPTEDDQEAI